MDLDIRQYLIKAKEEQGSPCRHLQLFRVVEVISAYRVCFISADSGALQSAYSLIQSSAAGGRGQTPSIASELYVVCAEAALQVKYLMWFLPKSALPTMLLLRITAGFSVRFVFMITVEHTRSKYHPNPKLRTLCKT